MIYLLELILQDHLWKEFEGQLNKVDVMGGMYIEIETYKRCMLCGIKRYENYT